MSSPHDFFSYQEGTLSSEGLNLTEIVKAVGTTTYVYSANALLSSYHRLEKGLHGLDHQICFAMKSNSNLAVIALLGRAGAGVDVVSGGELFRAQKANISHERI